MMLKIALMPNNRSLSQNGYSLDEQELMYAELLQDVFDNPRWYLDNVDYLSVFYVSWKNYRYKSPVMPYIYVRKTNTL